MKFDQINMCSQCLLKFWTQRLNQLFLLASKCELYVCLIRILSLVSFHYLVLKNRMSYINLSKFRFSPMLKAQLHHSHLSFSLLSSFESKPNFHFYTFSFLLLFFFFGLWIQLQVTHLALSSSFGLKNRLFMNFARKVHILCSIRLYENGLIKELKHKNQCPIYNAIPSCFGKFIFSLKTYLNLYLKWATTFRSPHLFFSF